jgi:sulfur carrier protein
MTENARAIGVYLNGEIREVRSGRALTEVIESLGLPLQGVLVEHNGRALLRSEWGEAELREGDRLEILRVVAGG